MATESANSQTILFWRDPTTDARSAQNNADILTSESSTNMQSDLIAVVESHSNAIKSHFEMAINRTRPGKDKSYKDDTDSDTDSVTRMRSIARNNTPKTVYYTKDFRTNQFIDMILKMDDEGVPRKEIAARLSISYEKLYTFMSRHMPWHIKFKHSIAAPITKEIHDEIYELANIKQKNISKKGYIFMIADRYNLSVEQIDNIRKRDIPRNYQKHPRRKNTTPPNKKARIQT